MLSLGPMCADKGDRGNAYRLSRALSEDRGDVAQAIPRIS